MSLKISTTPSEDQSTIRALLSANLFSVFDERDRIPLNAPQQSKTHMPKILLSGTSRTAISSKVAQVGQNIGVLRWHYGPEDKPDMVRGTDVIIVEGGKIRAL